MPGESPIRRHAAWGLACLALLVVSPYFERLNNPNENVRVWATRAVVQHHVLNIDQLQREWGYVNDKAKNEHHIYSGKAPGVSFLGVPVSWAHTKLRGLVGWPPPGKQETTFWLRLFAVKLPLCLFLLFFARYVERTTGSAYARDLLVAALGLGTLLYPYGGMFVGHALAAATAFTAFMLLDDERDGRAPAAAGGGGAVRGADRDVRIPGGAGVGGAGGLRGRALPGEAGGAGGVRRGGGAAGGGAGHLPHGAVRPAVAVSVRQVEIRVRARRARRRLPRPVVPQPRRLPRFCFRPRTGCSRFRRCWCWASPAWSCCSRARGRWPGARRDAALVTAVCC